MSQADTTMLKIQLLSDTAVLPSYGSAEAAGADLHADVAEVVTIRPHETAMIPTGIAVAVPKGCFGAVYARSGLASKQGLRPANDSESLRSVEPGERIAQLVIQPYVSVEFDVVEALDETERGAGGFGSTGSH